MEIKRLMVSAPTSYGKTFLMREILLLNKERYSTILLVFPTVALLQENAVEMIRFRKEMGLNFEIIKSVDGEINFNNKNIFVFTPERALQLLATYPDIKIDFFFFDEVYKIDEDYCNDELDEKNVEDDVEDEKISFLDVNRGKAFRIALYLLTKMVPEYYLAGPNLDSENFKSGMQEFLKKNKIHLKEILFEPTLRIGYIHKGSKLMELNPLRKTPGSDEIIPFHVTNLSSIVNERIYEVVQYIEKNSFGKTLLYCTTPAKASEYSNRLAERVSSKKFVPDGDAKELIEHIKRRYSIDKSADRWSFINVLENGYGMHHGKLPKYIQAEVLKQFNSGQFDVLFCTSTIVEGVNTNAQNVVILNASKGGEKLTVFDIKNIRGRAGRYYHNFIGRVFYIEKEVFKIVETGNSPLDFKTYSTQKLDSIDIDNADLVDLSKPNYDIKVLRMQSSEFALPNEICIKNRLVKREDQEKLFKELMKTETFKAIKDIVKNTDCESFLKYNWLRKILEVFVSADLIAEPVKIRFIGAAYGYYKNGFRSVLEYEFKQIGKGKYKPKNIDQAYSNAFKTLKDTIEHKIPKTLSLFEAVFIYAADQKGVRAPSFNLSKVKRFYETGVRSVLGEELIEKGFPIDTIRDIETQFPKLMVMQIKDSMDYCLEHREKISKILDSYEKKLINNAFKEMG